MTVTGGEYFAADSLKNGLTFADLDETDLGAQKGSRLMDWRSWSPEIKRVLALKDGPIAVSYSMIAPGATNGRRRSVCQALHNRDLVESSV